MDDVVTKQHRRCVTPSDTGWWFGTWILFFHILGIIIPIDFHILQKGWNHQPVVLHHQILSGWLGIVWISTGVGWIPAPGVVELALPWTQWNPKDRYLPKIAILGYRRFLKLRYPQVIHIIYMFFLFHCKPSIWEYPHVWKHPYGSQSVVMSACFSCRDEWGLKRVRRLPSAYSPGKYVTARGFAQWGLAEGFKLVWDSRKKHMGEQIRINAFEKCSQPYQPFVGPFGTASHGTAIAAHGLTEPLPSLWEKEVPRISDNVVGNPGCHKYGTWGWFKNHKHGDDLGMVNDIGFTTLRLTTSCVILTVIDICQMENPSSQGRCCTWFCFSPMALMLRHGCTAWHKRSVSRFRAFPELAFWAAWSPRRFTSKAWASCGLPRKQEVCIVALKMDAQWCTYDQFTSMDIKGVCIYLHIYIYKYIGIIYDYVYVYINTICIISI